MDDTFTWFKRLLRAFISSVITLLLHPLLPFPATGFPLFWLSWVSLAARAFSGCGEPALQWRWAVLVAVASPEERKLQGAGAQQLRLPPLEHGSIVVHRPSCSVICGIFPEQGSNLYPLHLQADSYPLHRQERKPPTPIFISDVFLQFLCVLKRSVRSGCLLVGGEESLSYFRCQQWWGERGGHLSKG